MNTKYYTITNVSEAACEIVKKLSEKEANFLKGIFKELNDNPEDSYAPTISIDLSTEEDLKRHGLSNKTKGFTSYYNYGH